MTLDEDAYDVDELDVSDVASFDSRFRYPTTPLLSTVYAGELSRSEPRYLRALAERMHGLPDRRREWLLEFADRIEAAGFASFAEVPTERFDEIAQLY